MAFAFVFPGQGSQSVGMLAGWSETPCVKDTVVEASDTLGQDFWAMLTEENTELNNTVNTQPLMLAAGVASFRAWQQAGGAMPTMMAGHSLGEYTALVAAGSLAYVDALRLVRVRGQAMQAAVPEGVGAMAAILGLDDAVLLDCCARASDGEVVTPVNYNSVGQTVIAGHKSAVERAMALVKEAGAKRALLLPVSVPSHCSLMQPAAEVLAEALQAITVLPARIPVLHNATVALSGDAEAIRAALVQQLCAPVRWVESMRVLAARSDVQHMVECGPGKVLAGLNKRIVELPTLTLTDTASVAQVQSVVAA